MMYIAIVLNTLVCIFVKYLFLSLNVKLNAKDLRNTWHHNAIILNCCKYKEQLQNNNVLGTVDTQRNTC